MVNPCYSWIIERWSIPETIEDCESIVLNTNFTTLPHSESFETEQHEAFFNILSGLDKSKIKIKRDIKAHQDYTIFFNCLA